MSDDWQVSASADVDAPAADVFDWLARPDSHVLLDGSGHVRGPVRSGRRMRAVGDGFWMRMRWVVPYVVRSRVSEFEEGRLIAWNHFAGHRWRWEVAEREGGGSRVTETFDASRAGAKEQYHRLGFPDGYREVLERSVAKVADHFAGRGA